ncbi:folate-binding protein YgfZ [Pelagibacterales bacterium SAG-MED13]|nr:folate-binding protein YgfZ [Pelagibacterales bacterium SAG-MED13]|tara:strand:+ start:265 stop:1152 length:888 start_codon:yes stop_codon:yes gene_type:complete
MNNKVFILQDRSIIYINGPDCEDFLQNLISNDINKVTNNSSCFASLLTPQGKFLFEFIIVKHKSGFFIDCEKAQSEEIFRQLNLYKIRSKVEILNLSNEFVVASFGYEKYLSIEGSKDILGFTFKYREDPIILDPRNKNLGARLIINLEKLYLSLKKLNLKDDKVENYYIKSHKLGIVPKNLNQLQNKLFGIECNYEELNGIDFKKGCYVGQENTARIKLKNKLSKRLLPINIIEGNLTENEKIYNNDVEIGKIIITDDYPFGLIKYQDKHFDKDQIFKSKNGSFKIFIPQWLKI